MSTTVVFETAMMSRGDVIRLRASLSREGKSICGHCSTVKTLGEFLVDSRQANGHTNRCRDCHLKVTTASRRLVATGWTQKQYDEALEKQNGRCAICKQPEVRKNRTLSADHCHATLGKRGLLCASCNLALGNFKDNVETLKAAIKYLEGS